MFPRTRLSQITGLHHVAAPALDCAAADRFWTGTLGLRRVKRTVDPDQPESCRYFYGNGCGAPGTALALVQGGAAPAELAFAIPPGSAPFWQERLGAEVGQSFGATQLRLRGPEGMPLALIESDDPRPPWTGAGIGPAEAIRGLHSAAFAPADPAPLRDLLIYLSYEEIGQENGITRLALPRGPARFIDILPPAGPPASGVTLSVANRARLFEVEAALIDRGHQVSPPRDHGYFTAITVALPDLTLGLATEGPGFASDEAECDLGTRLKLPGRHEHLRARLERILPAV